MDTQRDGWLKTLREKCFRAWPADSADAAESLRVAQAFSAPCGSLKVDAYDFTSQEQIRLRLFLVRRADLEPAKAERVILHLLDDDGWQAFLATFNISLAVQLKDEERVTPDVLGFAQTRKELEASSAIHAYVAPRGIGPTEWTRDPKKWTHVRRRFMLLGQTLDGMRTWDVRRAIQTLRTLPGLQETPLTIDGHDQMAGVALYAALFEPNVAELDLHQLPPSHMQGPELLNVLRFLDIPQAVAMGAERSKIRLHQDQTTGWEYPAAVAKSLGWDGNRLEIVHEEARHPREAAGDANR